LKTKILFLIPTLDRSGAEKQLTLLATGLPQDEFDARVVALTRGGPYEETLREQEIDVQILGKRWKFDPWALRRLKRILSDWRPDILHTWLFAANSYGRLAIGRPRDTKVIVSERCVDSWKSRWQLWFDRKLIPKTDLLVGNSQAVADFYSKLGVPEARLRVIHNGVDIPDPPKTSRQQILKELGIPENARVVGYVGRLAPQKRIRDLCWTVELISNLQPEIHFIIIGDGPERQALETFARETQNEDRIHFVGHQAEPARYFPAIEVFWLASNFEGLSNSVMEAMAAGLPVVASDIPPNRELVVPDETGYLVPVEDNVARAKYTNILLEDDDKRAACGAAGRERIRENFSVAGMVEAYAKLYRETLTK